MTLEELKSWFNEFGTNWKRAALFLAVIVVVIMLVAYVTSYVGEKAKMHATSKDFGEILIGPYGSLYERATEKGLQNEIVNATMDEINEVIWLFKLSEKNALEFNYNEAIENIEKSIELLPTMSAYLNLGYLNIFTYRLDKAEQAFSRGMKSAIKKAESDKKMSFLNGFGFVNLTRGNYNSALTFFEEALSTASEGKYTRGMLLANFGLGSVYNQRGEDKKAKDIFLLLEKSEILEKDLLLKASLYKSLGDVSSDLSHFNDAWEYYNESLRITQIMGHLDFKARINGNIANLCLRQRNMKQALKYNKKALDYYDKKQFLIQKMNLLLSRGDIYENLYDLTNAELSYKASLEIAQNTENQLITFKSVYIV